MNNDLNKELRTRTFGFISGAFGLVAGLAWNDAITALIEKLFPLGKDTVMIKFLYAIIVTVAVVILVRYLERMINTPSEPKP